LRSVSGSRRHRVAGFLFSLEGVMSAAHSPPASRAIGAALASALQAFADDARFLVALSGGIDSVVLLHAAVSCVGADRCVAAHINHGLNADADAWQLACAAYADTLGVSFVSRRVQIAPAPDDGIEAEARRARYDALATFYQEYDAAALLLGQHADDQAETVLLQLLRGAGLPGLAAMGAETEDGYGMVRVRPLLSCTRVEIERYARHHALHWVEDGSNRDTRFARNAIRQDLVPILARHFPGYRAALARSARHAAEAQTLLDQLAHADLQAARLDGGSDPSPATLATFEPAGDTADQPACPAISRAAFARLEPARAANLLRYWMRTLDLPAASEARLEQALRQLRSARQETALRLDHAGAVLRAYRDRISWERATPSEAQADLPAAQFLIWQGQTVWRLTPWRGTLVFRVAEAGATQALPAVSLRGQTLSVRARSGGERMRMGPDGRSRTLKNLFQERGIPAWRRHLPLLWLDDILLWVPGLGLNHDAVTRLMQSMPAAVQASDWLGFDWVEDMLLA